MKVAVSLVMSLADAAAVQAPRPATQTQTVCALADLAGDLTAQSQGILTGPFAGPFASIGVIHFDGNGGFTGIAAASF